MIGGWAIAIFTGLAVVYGAAWTDASTPQYVVVLYNTFTRPAFALAVGWVAFACIMGYGGNASVMLHAVKYYTNTIWFRENMAQSLPNVLLTSL